MPYVELQDISLYYEDAGVGDPPVLLLHELGGSSESWRRVIPLITPHRRVIAPDMRCAGRSEKPRTMFEITDVGSDISALLDILHISSVDIVGTALGAMVAAIMASQLPERVRRLVLCAVTDTVDQRTREYLTQRAEHLRTAGMRGVVEASLLNAFPERHATARAGYRPIYLANDPAAYAELSKALARMSATRDLWRNIPCPTLVMSGQHDFIWPPERRIVNHLPHATFLELADAGHFPHLQTPQALSDAALVFLSRTLP
jgi:3-oxoadipate enol-lactonase